MLSCTEVTLTSWRDSPSQPMKRGVDPKLFEKIADVIEGDGLVCAGTMIDNMDMGIFGGHAYSITSTCSVPYRNKMVNLVKVLYLIAELRGAFKKKLPELGNQSKVSDPLPNPLRSIWKYVIWNYRKRIDPPTPC